jgi:peptide/nickel transport system substrate-binding protein
MHEDTYWMQRRRRALTRRTFVAGAASLGAGLGGLALAGCSTRQSTSAAKSSTSGSAAAETPKSGGTYNASLTLNAPLDPHKISGSPHVATSGVYSRLFRFKVGADPRVITNHDLESELGLSAESPDAVTWTVKLRPDARFTNTPPVNGHPVEAEDVKATFVRSLDPAISNPNRGSVTMIDPAQIETPNATTIVFKLRYPYAPFKKFLASPVYSFIMPREALAGSYDPSKVVIGSGPFTLESFTPDVAYVYKKNPEWFEKGMPYVDALRVAIVPDSSQRLAQFTAGNLDEFLPSADDLATAKQNNPKASVIVGADGTPSPVFWQLGDPTSAFLDIRVRRALSMAIDRDALGKVLYNDQSVQTILVPAYLGKWSLAVKDLPADIQQYYKYNPADAKKLLEAAGASNLQLRYGYIVNGTGGFSTPIYRKHAETVSNMLNAAGIKTNLVSIDYNKDYIDSGKGSSQGYYEKDMIIDGGLSVYTEADEYLYNFYHSKSTNSHQHLNDPTMDAMIDKQRGIVDEAERLKAALEVEKYIAEKVYLLATVGSYKWTMVQPRVRNYLYSDSPGEHTETYAKLWLAG